MIARRFDTAHRPWPLPQRPWVLAQSWCDLLFAHWRAAPETVAALLPAGLELDTFAGSAWIGVVPFRMSDVHPRLTLSVPGLSYFPELNVRTYARRDGKPGVWFFSLDASSRVAVAQARRWFHLPYYRAEMRVFSEGGWIRYRSERRDPRAPAAIFEGCYRPTTPVWRAERGSLDEWLTERYCLYCTDARGRLYRGEVHHDPWPLQRAEAQITVNTMVQGIALADEPPVLHYAARLDVQTWALERLSS